MRCFLHLRGNPENLKRSVVSMINMVKLPTKKSNLFLRVAKGHFATRRNRLLFLVGSFTILIIETTLLFRLSLIHISEPTRPY